MLVLKRNSRVSTPQSHRHLPRSCPCVFVSGPDMQECETRMSACTWQAEQGLGRSLAQCEWVGWPGVCVGVRVGHPGPGVRRGWPLLWEQPTTQRGRHVGQGRADSREKAGGHGEPAVPTLSLGRRQEGWEPRHTIGR
ncbi:unnamed protein product [Pipistrellus nathusii]|uniref:Uncharacterized protein n=1 Tax=Pipistrellus nathusii TaxID=59473 RepID=A0ABP0A0G4_PIPNA